MRWLLVLLLLAVPATAQEGIDPGDIRIELALEERAHAPHPGEMVLLSIHGTYRIPVVREKLRQPELAGFDWMQLGEDRWYKDREDGFEVLKFERRMALFPRRAGAIPIPAFTHGLDMLSRRGQTVTVDSPSNALVLDVAEARESAHWWFPVRRMEISDSWSNQPERLAPGSAALRIVTLTVEGVEPQLIPPMPELTGAGAYIFPHPEHKITALGPDGPVTRVFWRWTVRPREGSAGYLNPVTFAYFDTETREEHEITLAGQRVAHRDGPQEVREAQAPQPEADLPEREAAAGWPALPGWTVPGSALLGLVLGAVALGRGMRWSDLRPARDGTRRALRRAAARGDAGAVRRLSHALLAEAGQAPPEALRALDAALYGGASMPDPKAVARAVLKAAQQTPQPPRRRAISPREGS
ncbi:MAG: hypothetical protein AAFR79_01925 [Pseudomonadota bacterium]